MDYKDILDASWLFLKYAHEEWGLFSPDLPEIEMTTNQLDLYKKLKIRYQGRLQKTHKLAELKARLDILNLHEDMPEFLKAIKAFEKAIKKLKYGR